MKHCQECKTEWDDTIQQCPMCGKELLAAQPEENGIGENHWVMLGSISNKISADFGKEVLASYDIQVVVISKSGFFGDAGLMMPSFYKSGLSLYEVSVKKEDIEEANELLKMALGDSWERKEA